MNLSQIKERIAALDSTKQQILSELITHSAQHLAEATKHTAEAEAAQAFIDALEPKPPAEDRGVAIPSFALTSPSKTRASAAAAIRWGLVGAAGLVAVWGVLHGHTI